MLPPSSRTAFSRAITDEKNLFRLFVATSHTERRKMGLSVVLSIETESSCERKSPHSPRRRTPERVHDGDVGRSNAGKKDAVFAVLTSADGDADKVILRHIIPQNCFSISLQTLSYCP